ncbi:MAG TPA: ATP-dependent helicase [Solirubrobacterales bacterium]|nr:ATP-dependent helicase [Solirubrobacterales bacterium]
MANATEAPPDATRVAGTPAGTEGPGLDPEQGEAVHAPLEHPLLIVAGPGAGKTRVLTQRIIHLVRGGRLAPTEVVAITFTNEAVKEMSERVEAGLGEGSRGVRISTIHALAAQVVRRHAQSVGLDSRFSIFDADDQLLVARAAVEQAEAEVDPVELVRRIATAKANLEDAALWSVRGEAAAARAFDIYEAELAAANALDFEGLLRAAVIVLSDARVAAGWRAGVRALLVDEFHDVSEAQFAMVRLLVPDGAGLTVVADDDQVIYAFRGADPEFTVAFERWFPAARAIVLRRNYRSHAGIVDCALRLISHNVRRREKALEAASGVGPDPVFERYDSEEDEAEAIAVWAQGHIGAGEPPGELGVLVRMRGLKVRGDLEVALATRGIPYVTLGERPLFERADVRDALAWLALTVNPRNSAAFARALQSRPGLGPASVRALVGAARSRGASLESVCLVPAEAGIAGKRGEAAAAFGTSMAEIRRLGGRPREFKDLVDAIIVASGIPERLRQMGRRAGGRLEGVREVSRAARSYQRLCTEEGRAPRLAEFLEELTLHAGERRRPAEAVALGTVHAVKGLEFRHVWLAGMDEDVLPSMRSLRSGDVEEERRLAYVALTRARETLVLSSSARRWNREAAPSRFLSEAGLRDPAPDHHDQNPAPAGAPDPRSVSTRARAGEEVR